MQASQALEDLKADPSAHISTGLAALDCALLGLDSEDFQNALGDRLTLKAARRAFNAVVGHTIGDAEVERSKVALAKA